MDEILKVKGITKRFDDIVVFENLSLTVKKGEVVEKVAERELLTALEKYIKDLAKKILIDKKPLTSDTN